MSTIPLEYVNILFEYEQVRLGFQPKKKVLKYAWSPNTASSKISGNKCCEINKTLNPVTIIHHPQSLW